MQAIERLLGDYSELAEKTGFEEPKESIGKNVKKEIRNILQNDELTDFLICLTQHGAIGESDNIGNKFEVEREVKILDIDLDDLISKLGALNAKEIFRGTIDDIFLDYEDKRLDSMEEKVSFRIRIKFSQKGKLKLFYTIKKKIPKDKSLEVITRDCYEKEFEIINPGLAFDILKLVNIQESRRKTKQRVAFTLDELKFDIDTYQDIPPLLEIETDRVDQIPGIITMLGLNNHETSAGGSRWLFERYNKQYNMVQDPKSKLSLPDHLTS